VHLVNLLAVLNFANVFLNKNVWKIKTLKNMTKIKNVKSVTSSMASAPWRPVHRSRAQAPRLRSDHLHGTYGDRRWTGLTENDRPRHCEMGMSQAAAAAAARPSRHYTTKTRLCSASDVSCKRGTACICCWPPAMQHSTDISCLPSTQQWNADDGTA